MHKYKKVRRYVITFATLLSFFMVGSSWAYWAQELLVRNEYKLATYKTDIVEVFESPKSWKPGVNVNKDVTIKNDGTVPVFVKLVLNQKWVRTGNVYDLSGNIVLPAKGDSFPLIFDGGSGKEYAALIQWGSKVVLLSSGLNSTASLSLGLPTVSSPKDAEGKWLLISETPDSDGNYTLYYIGTLDAGAVSPLIVDGVLMNGDIRATILEDRTVWNKQQQRWITTGVNNSSYSYENARYTLTVTMHTVQATKDALTETFKSDRVTEQSVISQLGSFEANLLDLNYSYDDSVKTHRLYFEEVNGVMTYTPVRYGNENWFMSDLNMVPGGAYNHTMLIENRSAKNYDLYMQVIPLKQERKLDELLELIAMKVYHGSELLYDGTAMGKSYSGSINDLHNAILLGHYKSKAENQIYVELVLDKNTSLDYAGLLTQIDWKFMVEDVTETDEDTDLPMSDITGGPDYTPGPVPVTSGSGSETDDLSGLPMSGISSGGDGPKTGDEGDGGFLYILAMSISGFCLAGCVLFLVATRRKDQAATGPEAK